MLRVLGLFGPSGAGKTTLARLLAARWPEFYEQAPTISTRAPRPDDAGAYITVTEPEFDRLSRASAFLAETEIRASAERRLYAYRRSDAEAASARGHIVVAPVESQLTRCLRAALGPAELLVIGLMPPGADRAARLATLAARMSERYRGAPEALADRLRNAAAEDLPVLEAALGAVTSLGESRDVRGSGAFIDYIEMTDTPEGETAVRIHDQTRRWFTPSRNPH